MVILYYCDKSVINLIEWVIYYFLASILWMILALTFAKNENNYNGKFNKFLLLYSLILFRGCIIYSSEHTKTTETKV